MFFGTHNEREISSLTETVLGSKEFCFMELIFLLYLLYMCFTCKKVLK
jgi:hypothetical protein